MNLPNIIKGAHGEAYLFNTEALAAEFVIASIEALDTLKASA